MFNIPHADDGDEYYYVPELDDEYDRDMPMDDTGDLLWGHVSDALRNLYEEHGHSGPFTFDQFYNALIDAVIDPEIKSLIDKGLMEAVMQRDGTMGYKLTPLGEEAARELMGE